MADNFNMKQFLAENKLGAYSKLREVDEAKEEEGYMGTQYDSSEDMAVDMVKKGITEYEVIYFIENGKCYRRTDEGYEDEGDRYYCRLYAEGKEEEQFGGINEDYGYLPPASFERMSGLVKVQSAGKMIAGAQDMKDDLRADGFEDDEIREFLIKLITNHI